MTGRDLEPAPDLFDALANLDPYAAIADAGARAALTMAKIAADIGCFFRTRRRLR